MARVVKVFFEDMQAALIALREKEVEHLIVDHELKAGDGVPADFHKSNEWIIFPPGEGKFKLSISALYQDWELSSTRVMAILVPAHQSHSLEAISDISYTVLRDGLD